MSPVLTVVLGAVDSINPCAMFILFILLGLIVHAQSRRRMILVGGIFIFFSGLWYVLFMFILLTTFSAFEAGIVAIVVGCIAVMFGIVNIKDFFFYKKGVSLSIPDDKKPGIYRQMRNLVKTPYISTAILGTILLAVTVNLFEFLCSLQWPLFYVATLNLHALPAVENYLYILLYNIIYVIPLVVIVLVFAFTLGRIKLSVWQSQVLKLFSGIMILSFGVLFLVNYKILEDVMTPILLLVLSVVATTVIAIVWKRVQIAKEVN